MQKLFSRISSIGASPADSEETKLQKSLLVVCSIPFIVAAALWGCLYIGFGEIRAAWIPLSYSLFSLASLAHFGFTHRFSIFRFNQLLLILILPFALTLALGGVVSGSAVILWSVLSPLGALLFDKPANALRLLLAFLALAILSVALQPLLRTENNLAAWQIYLFFVINLMTVTALVFLMVYYFVGKKNFFQQRSEMLLLNILPKGIADELKAHGRAKARLVDEVTVMFTDFRDFTRVSEKLSPADLVSELDTCFKAFDEITGKYKLEKIKTIGDSYMCAGGLSPDSRTPAADMLHAALEILDFISRRREQNIHSGKESFEIRIGIHTGPVVAGIVGSRKFAYDIWGDTVNIASRMESSGEAGKINISGTTYALVKDKFNCIYRGKIKSKNKEETDMYFVESVCA